jgi:hypothetical protein
MAGLDSESPLDGLLDVSQPGSVNQSFCGVSKLLCPIAAAEVSASNSNKNPGTVGRRPGLIDCLQRSSDDVQLAANRWANHNASHTTRDRKVYRADTVSWRLRRELHEHWHHLWAILGATNAS